MRVEAYLERIGYAGSIEPTADTLRALQYAHIHSVPYENLDIIHGVPISLAPADLYEKIVQKQRGGYCFELNGLFAWLLRELGYEVTEYFARFLRDEPVGAIPMRRHRVLAVNVENECWLCDVGVGTGVSRVPLLFDENETQTFENESYRLIRQNDEWVVEEYTHQRWSAVYSFTTDKQYPVDYEAINYYCQHAPESLFNKAPMVALRTKNGRRTVSGREFRQFTDEGVETFTPPESEQNAMLAQWFGIKI